MTSRVDSAGCWSQLKQGSQQGYTRPQAGPARSISDRQTGRPTLNPRRLKQTGVENDFIIELAGKSELSRLRSFTWVDYLTPPTQVLPTSIHPTIPPRVILIHGFREPHFDQIDYNTDIACGFLIVHIQLRLELLVKLLSSCLELDDSYLSSEVRVRIPSHWNYVCLQKKQFVLVLRRTKRDHASSTKQYQIPSIFQHYCYIVYRPTSERSPYKKPLRKERQTDKHRPRPCRNEPVPQVVEGLQRRMLEASPVCEILYPLCPTREMLSCYASWEASRNTRCFCHRSTTGKPSLLIDMLSHRTSVLIYVHSVR